MTQEWSTLRAIKNFKTVLDVAATVAMLIAAGLIIWKVVGSRSQPAITSQRAVPLPTEPVSLEGAPVLGVPAAKVAILEFSDFECPFCQRFSTEALPEIKLRYIDSGKVKLVFRHLPLTKIHPRALPAATAAACAARQGKFWEMHDALFRDRAKLQDADIANYAAAIDLDGAAFNRCQVEPRSSVEEDLDAAVRLQLRSTPAFLFGAVQQDGRLKVQQVLTGARPTAEFIDAIEAVMKEL
jgi:protein-disulfide isomerase